MPFHFYAPDVYEGGPAGVVAQLAFVPKVAGFARCRALRQLGADAGARTTAVHPTQFPLLLWILAAVTMSLGNVLALLQDNVRRMLAYSSVAHAGYMLIGLAVLPARRCERMPTEGWITGGDAVLFYLVAYGAMTVGAFAVIPYLTRRSGRSIRSTTSPACTKPTRGWPRRWPSSCSA